MDMMSLNDRNFFIRNAGIVVALDWILKLSMSNLRILGSQGEGIKK